MDDDELRLLEREAAAGGKVERDAYLGAAWRAFGFGIGEAAVLSGLVESARLQASAHGELVVLDFSLWLVGGGDAKRFPADDARVEARWVGRVHDEHAMAFVGSLLADDPSGSVDVDDVDDFVGGIGALRVLVGPKEPNGIRVWTWRGKSVDAETRAALRRKAAETRW